MTGQGKESVLSDIKFLGGPERGWFGWVSTRDQIMKVVTTVLQGELGKKKSAPLLADINNRLNEAGL